jgi:hypothetical protein
MSRALGVASWLVSVVALGLGAACSDAGEGAGGLGGVPLGGAGGGAAGGAGGGAAGGAGGGAAGGAGGEAGAGAGGDAGAGGAGGEAGAGGAGGGAGGSGGAGGAPPEGSYGSLSGSCGVVGAAEVLSPAPLLVANVLDFSGRAPLNPLNPTQLSPGGLEVYADGNLGGSSLDSEAFAFETLHRCEGATLLKTEAEIVYSTMGKKTDLLVDIDGLRVGVSVVRAMSFPEGAPFPLAQAQSLLEGKLGDILLSSSNVAPVDAWEKQILSVLAQTPEHATAIADAWALVDPAVRADTIVYVTLTEGDDAFVYYN